MKHTSNTIREEYFQDSSNIIMGFYVEDVVGVNAVGPDDDIHPRHDGNTRSANSYNFKLRELYYLLYMLSETLKETLKTHYIELYGQNLEFNERVNEDHRITDENWRELLERIQRLPHEYFPSEFGAIFWDVSEESDRLIFAENIARSMDLDGSFGGKQRGDGYTLTFGVPFLSEDTFRE
jgi:hypothetical protein